MGKKSLTAIITPIVLLSSFLIYLPSRVFSQEVKEKRIVRVGAYENYPKIFTDDNGGFEGIFPDILKYISEKENWEIKYVHGTWSECLMRLERGDIDLMVDVAYSEERAELYEFTEETVFINWGVVYTRIDANIQSIPDLDGMYVAVMNDSIHTTGPDGIKSIIKDFELEVTYNEVDNYTQVLELLDNKKADAGIVNRVFGDTFAEDYAVRKTPIVINPVKLKFALPKGADDNEYLINTIDKHVFELTKDPYSVYYKSINTYFPENDQVRIIEIIPKWLLGIFIVSSVLLVVFFLVSTELNRRVKKRTAELKALNIELTEKIKLQKEVEEKLRKSEQVQKNKIEEYEQLYKLTLGREKKMEEMKKQIETMEK